MKTRILDYLRRVIISLENIIDDCFRKVEGQRLRLSWWCALKMLYTLFDIRMLRLLFSDWIWVRSLWSITKFILAQVYTSKLLFVDSRIEISFEVIWFVVFCYFVLCTISIFLYLWCITLCWNLLPNPTQKCKCLFLKH